MLTRTNRFMLATLTGALLATGCGGDDNNGGSNGPPTDGNTINATPSETFTPASLTINAGETLTFVFGSLAHNVFFDQDTAPDDIPAPTSNASVDRTFPTAGTFTYTCHIHPQMHGTVVVQ